MEAKMQKKRVAPYLSDNTIEFYRKIFGSASNGLTIVAGSWPDIYTQTLREIGGVFTVGEISMLIDIYNGHALSPAGLDSLHIQVQDSFDLYPGVYEDKWQAQREDMLRKVDALTIQQRACLEIWAVAFWHGDYEHKNSIKNHCKIMEAL
jgi:hypothetical protein